MTFGVKALFPKTDPAIEHYFESIGYSVGYEGRLETGERWYEIYDDNGMHFQISMPAPPIGELIADLPYLIEGKSGIGPTDYWIACPDNAKLHELLRRVRDAEATSSELS